MELAFTREKEAGQGTAVFQELLRAALKDHLAPFPAGPRPHVHHVVGLEDGLGVVLHHHHGVAQVPQHLQGIEEFLGIPGMQADAGLIQDVEDAAELGADLGGQPDALAFPAGQGAGGPVQGEVVQAYFLQKPEALGDLLEEPAGDLDLAGAEVQRDEPAQGPGHGEAGDFTDVGAVQAHRQGLPAQARPAAIRAGAHPHVLLDLFPHQGGVGLFVALLEDGDDAGKGPGFIEAAAALLLKKVDGSPFGAVENGLLGLLGEVFKRRVDGEMVVLLQGLQDLLMPQGVARGPGAHGALAETQIGVGDHQVGVDDQAGAQAGAGRAGALGTVEGEEPGGELRQRDAAVVAGEALGEEQFLAALDQDAHQAVGQLQGQFQGVGEAGAQVGLDHQPVHHGLDGVAPVLVERRQFLQFQDLAVDPHPAVALVAQALQELLVLAFAVHHHRGQKGDAAAFGQAEDLVHHLGDAQGGDGPAAAVTVRGAHPGEEDPQVVIDFGGGGHGGARVAGGAALLDGDGGRETLDVLHVRLIHEFQELPGVGREGLDIAPLALGVKDVEGQGGFAGAADAGDDDKAVPGQLHVDVLEIVFPGAPDNDLAGGHMVLKAEDGRSNGELGSRGRLGRRGRLLLGLGLAAPFLFDFARDKFDPLGPAGPAGPQQGAGAQLADNLGQGAVQVFGRDYRDFQF